jgi:hypothetical protein
LAGDASGRERFEREAHYCQPQPSSHLHGLRRRQP